MVTLPAGSSSLTLRALAEDLYSPEKAAGIQLKNIPNSD